MKLEIQRFGGRGATSSSGVALTKEKLSMSIAREIYGKYISDTVAKRYGKEMLYAPEGAVLSDYADWELNKETGEYTIEGLKNRLTYLTKGYDASMKEGEKFQKAYDKKKRK